MDYVIRTGVDVTAREEAQAQARDSNAAVRTLSKKSEVTLLQYQNELQALTARLLGLQEAGNKDLARELHDDLSQKLAALGMEVSTLLQPSSGSSRDTPGSGPCCQRSDQRHGGRCSRNVPAASSRNP